MALAVAGASGLAAGRRWQAGPAASGCARTHKGARRWPPAAAAALLALLCAACAGPVPTGAPNEVAFDLRGRFSVAQGDRVASGNFLWRQFTAGFELDLWGPLGQGRARLIGGGGALTLVNGRGEVVADGDAEALMRQELGWAAPLDAFAAWVTGRPAPSWPARIHGRGLFEQLGWRVEVTAWRDVGGQPLPRRIEASRRETRIVVACREWASPPWPGVGPPPA